MAYIEPQRPCTIDGPLIFIRTISAEQAGRRMRADLLIRMGNSIVLIESIPVVVVDTFFRMRGPDANRCTQMHGAPSSVRAAADKLQLSHGRTTRQ